jgi:tRNA 5-methylaminomethyl-2-thiouridine biosynthesis bifunctional protein
MRPASLIAAQLAAASVRSSLTTHYATGVHEIRREGAAWQALRPDGTVIASAPVLVLANSTGVTRLAAIGAALDRVRGQVTYVPEEALRAPRAVLTGPGYVLPASEGIVVIGSTYDSGESDPKPNERGHEANLMRLSRLLPEASAPAGAPRLDGAVGCRCATPDRMPLIGAVPDVDLAREHKARLSGAQLNDVPRRSGLYCATGFASRGLIGATLAAEIVCSLLEGGPQPVESDLADAVDPARFVLRQARRGRL